MRMKSAEKRRDEGVVADRIRREETGREGADIRERMEAAERGQDEGAVMDY